MIYYEVGSYRIEIGSLNQHTGKKFRCLYFLKTNTCLQLQLLKQHLLSRKPNIEIVIFQFIPVDILFA